MIHNTNIEKIQPKSHSIFIQDFYLQATFYRIFTLKCAKEAEITSNIHVIR